MAKSLTAIELAELKLKADLWDEHRVSAERFNFLVEMCKNGLKVKFKCPKKYNWGNVAKDDPDWKTTAKEQYLTSIKKKLGATLKQTAAKEQLENEGDYSSDSSTPPARRPEKKNHKEGCEAQQCR